MHGPSPHEPSSSSFELQLCHDLPWIRAKNCVPPNFTIRIFYRNLLCLTEKDLNFQLLSTRFCVENSFLSFHYQIVQQLLNSGKNPYYSSGDNPRRNSR
jgi:hypothetical protein